MFKRCICFFFQAEDGIRDLVRSRGLGDVYKRQVMSGYQEVITDPSYAGQIISFTYPHIGNYGVNDHDFESVRPFCRGVIVRLSLIHI